ncbi:MAG TPA: hypothetical protein VJ552_09225 [Sediminibacterium sp.]|nr:hypothetical protein [Sediminibacterium sp.]
MKKLLIIVVSLFVLIALVSFLLPSEQKISHSVIVDCPTEAPTRLVSNPAKWSAWWPGQQLNDSVWSSGQTLFQVQKILLNGFQAQTRKGRLQGFVDFNFFMAANGGTQFNINGIYRFSSNPFTKTLQYISMMDTKKTLLHFMQQVEVNFSNIEKVYGFNIERKQLVHTAYVSLKQPFDHQPSVVEIDSLVKELKQYIASQQGREMDAPIMNVYTGETGAVEAMVAIATDRELPSTNRFLLKNMVRNGYVMVAEVKGGPQVIDSCKKELENYVLDYRKSSPAIPFQQMITDRVKEKDSSRWITRLFYPVRN